MNTSFFRAGGAAALAVLVCLVCAFLAYGVTQEVPVGQVSGTVRLGESGKPFAGASVLLRPKTVDDQGLVRARLIRADKNGRFSLRNLPAALYSVEVTALAHELPKTTLLVEEGKAAQLDLKLKPMDPYLTLYANQHVFLPEERPFVQIHGFVREKELDVEVWSIPTEAFLQKRDFYQVFSPIAQAQTPKAVQESGAKRVQSFKWPIQPSDAEGTFKRPLEMSQMKPGFYFLRVSAGKPGQKEPLAVRGTYLLVTDIALVAKKTDGELYLYATRLKTGEPTPGAKIRVATSAGTREAGVTNEQGLMRSPLPRMAENASEMRAVVATLGESAAVVTFGDYANASDRMRFHVVTDRPIYRPGDKVHFKAIARRPNGARYSLPNETTGTFEVRDYQDRVLRTETVALSSFGTLSGSFDLPEESTEWARLIVNVGGARTETGIRVAAYRKPEFRMTATPVKPYYVRGDVVEMKVKAEYFFCGPVVGAKLTGTLQRGPLYEWFDPETGETEDYSYGGEYLGDIEGVTDSNGEAVLRFDTRTLDPKSYDDNDERLTFTLSGTEGDDRFFEGSGQVNLLRGDLSVMVEPDQYVVTPGDAVSLKVNLKPADPNESVNLAGREILVESGYVAWDDRGANTVYEERTTIVTDRAGEATVQVTPQNPGDFRVRVSVKDRGGRTVSSSAWIWVWRENFAFGGPEPDVQVVLDKRTYKVGETAKALIRTSAKGASAWVTLETSSVVQEKLVKLSSGLTTVEFPVTDELMPNAFVAVSFVHNKKYREAKRRLTLDLSGQRLNVSIKSDKQVYLPGETATYTIRTTDTNGKPVRSEVAVGVVDEAIYALAEDNNDPMETFYPYRGSLISTFMSFPELYLDGGDKGDAEIDLREDFRDTASFAPMVTTGADGTATLQVALPDNLTSWRATATAVDLETRVGKSISNAIVKKDLMVRLATPQFAVQTDELTLTANVNNGTDQAMDVKVKLQAEGVEILDEAEKTASVEANRSSQVTWRVRWHLAGRAKLTVTAAGPRGLTDGMRVEVPVSAHGKRELSGKAGELTESETTFEIEVLPGANRGSLKVSASPTMISPLLDSIEDLVQFPYGCVEQTISRFVPAAVAQQLLRETNTLDPELGSKIEEVTRQSLGRLREMQASDGGWGWFPSEGAQPYTTAIALEGLGRARDAGVDVDGRMLSNGVAWAQRWLRSEQSQSADPDTVVAVAAAVARLAPTAEATAALRARPLVWTDSEKQRRELSTEALAKIVVALKDDTSAGASARRSAALQELWARAAIRRDSITWSDTWGARNTARSLEAVLAATPSDERIALIVRGLLLDRRTAGWTSTYDTGLAIQALIPVLRRTGGFDQSASVEILLDGAPATVSTLAGGVVQAEWPIASLEAGKRSVTIRRTGQGSGFYSYVLDQTPFRESLPAQGIAGLKIERTFHSLAAERMEDGRMQLRPSVNPIQSIASGEVVRCRVTIDADQPMSYALIEVPLPSNLRINVMEAPESWDYWYTGLAVLDDRVAFFASTVPKGRSVVEFNLRAEAVGKAKALPAIIAEMYAPDQQASTSDSTFEVTR